MFNFINQLLYKILSIQEKLLMKKLGKRFKSGSINTRSRKNHDKSISLEISNKESKSKEKLEHGVSNILKKFNNEPSKLLKFVAKNGTKVYKINYADKILSLIGLEEGFVPKTKGFKALYLNFIVSFMSSEKLVLSLKTKEMFVLRDMEIDSYYMIQQFHKWYAMKLNLPGFDAESQAIFNEFLQKQKDEKIKEMSIDDLLNLKDAIARDVEAINFVVELAKSTSGAKAALQKIKLGGASI